MLSSEARDLSKTLLKSKLLTPQQWDDCLNELGGSIEGLDPVFSYLERKGLLTSYQIGQLRKGETDSIVLGEYALQYRNASGSFARVYRAKSLKTGQMVGIKVLRQRWSEDPRTVAQFRREAELGKTLKHDNIVPIYEVAESNGQHFLTMEFVEGGNLRDFLTIRGKLSPLEATRCVMEIAQGLAYALTKGLTHRDMKLTNVLMSARGVAKLVDFGLAGAEGSGPGGSARGESAQRAIEYATIEKGTGVQRDDPRSDLYFLGAIYWELLAGIPPFARTKDRVERSQFSRYAGVRPLSQVDASIPRSVSRVVERLMQINPNLRYQTPNEVVGDLRGVLNELLNGVPAAGEANNGKPAERTQPMVMCIDNRPESQDVLRNYFAKHGYRPLILSDIERGLNRVRDNPPDCVVIMGESVGEDAVRGFRKIPEIANELPPACVLVLSEKQKALREDLTETGTMRIAQQPLSLRELHRLVHKALKRRGGPTIITHRKKDAGNK